MTKRDIDMIAAGFAEAERLNAECPDTLGMGAATLRIAVSCVAAEIKARHPRFHVGRFEIDAMPISAARRREAIWKALASCDPPEATEGDDGIGSPYHDRTEERDGLR